MRARRRTWESGHTTRDRQWNQTRARSADNHQRNTNNIALPSRQVKSWSSNDVFNIDTPANGSIRLNSTMIGLLGFILCLVPYSSSDSKSSSNWLILVFHLCPFTPKSSNCSIMALTFIAFVFWADFWWWFLVRFTLFLRWMLNLWLDGTSRGLCRDLSIVRVFFSDWKLSVRKIL